MPTSNISNVQVFSSVKENTQERILIYQSYLEGTYENDVIFVS